MSYIYFERNETVLKQTRVVNNDLMNEWIRMGKRLEMRNMTIQLNEGNTKCGLTSKHAYSTALHSQADVQSRQSDVLEWAR